MKKIIFSLVLTFFFSIGILIYPAQAAVINILTLDETRIGEKSNDNGTINFNFATGGGYQIVRESLLMVS